MLRTSSVAAALTAIVLVGVACGHSASSSSGANDSGGGGADSGTGDDSGGTTSDASADSGGGTTDSGGGGNDAGAPWTPVKMTCPKPGNYNVNNWGNNCGAVRWSIKTGTDSAASSISLLPTLSTATTLAQQPTPTTLPQFSRVSPQEDTVYVLENVKIQLLRLEDDGDYHLIVAQGPFTLIAEIPYPGCVRNPSPWACFVSRARAAVDAKYAVDIAGMNPNAVATVVGVGFYDNEHGQSGAAPNNIELHTVLGLCFGQNCDPNQ